MNSPKIFKGFFYFYFGVIMAFTSVFAEDINPAPEPLQAAIFLKLLGFNQNLASGGDVSVYVVASPGFASEMKKAIGKKVGAATIKKVDEGDGIPSEKPSIIYLGPGANVSDMTSYSKSNKILSITGTPDFSSKGATLLVGVSGGKPKIILNLTSSKEEGINWNPAILKVASTVK